MGGNFRHAPNYIVTAPSIEAPKSGPVRNISQGSSYELAEGPHLFKRSGTNNLTDAEDGTNYQHAVTMLRLPNIDDPIELQPNLHLMKRPKPYCSVPGTGRWWKRSMGRHTTPICALDRCREVNDRRWAGKRPFSVFAAPQ
jgi:beta-xylosidase